MDPYAAHVQTDVQVAVLGPVEATLDGAPVDLGTPKQRALLGALALHRGRAVSVDAVIDLLWDDPPAGATATLQAYISGLRKVLEPRRERRAPATVLVTVAPGYALRLPVLALDAARFEATVTDVHRLLSLPLLGAPTVAAETLRQSAGRLDEALGWWRGTPYVELGDIPDAAAERAHLEELRLVALEDRAMARLALGDHATTAAELESLTERHPLRERLWALRAVALVRAGRQADALEVLREVRRVLGEELGLDPGAELRDLQDRVLRQDPLLAWAPPREAGAQTPLPAPTASAPGGELPDDELPAVAAGWPMVGRDRELGALRHALDQALAGRPAFAVVTGEPGIGKSRLCAELASEAEHRGMRVLTARCSQDEGAPPLWPWVGLLEALRGAPEEPGRAAEDTETSGEFATWERITRVVREAAADRPLLLLLDDLHWADTASLRVLRLLTEAARDEQLLVLVTWRDRPRPAGVLADVAEGLARRHAIRVELTGLDDTSVAGVVASVSGRTPTEDEAGTLRRRTDGNPFFLIEYARLAESRDELRRLLTEENPPTAVQEVLTRRLDRLPETTRRVLDAAAVVGRTFDLASLAAMTDLTEDELLDAVEPAQAAGLVAESGVDRLVFAHALVRDTLYAGLSPSRRARRHARIAGRLEGLAGRQTEVARHWLAAGPAYAAKAWRAAREAAAIASAAYAYPEASTLLRAALDALGDDPDASLRDRYDLLMELVTAYRWSAMWSELIASVEEAVGVADALGDPVLSAQAAISTTQGALWQSAAHGQVHEEIVRALRRSLDALPAADSALRCRCLLSLANELYYATTFAERRALVDEALAMARRLDDPALLLDACQIWFVTTWAPSTGEERLTLATEAMELAGQTGNEQGLVVSATLRAVVLSELGRVAEMWRAVARARAEAERLRIVYGLIVLDSLVLPWHAMRGDTDECETILEHLGSLVGLESLAHTEDALHGAVISIDLWQRRADRVLPMLADLEQAPFPMSSTITTCRWRLGDEDGARAFHAAHPVDLSAEDWFSMLNWGNAAAAALFMGDTVLAADAYARLAPYPGRVCSAGSGNASGPIDGYLALAAAAAGETDLAGRHADEALRLAREWEIPLFATWLDEQRDRFHF